MRLRRLPRYDAAKFDADMLLRPPDDDTRYATLRCYADAAMRVLTRDAMKRVRTREDIQFCCYAE